MQSPINLFSKVWKLSVGNNLKMRVLTERRDPNKDYGRITIAGNHVYHPCVNPI